MEAYKERMKNEYLELKERHEKLCNMLSKYYAGTLDFVPTCPIALLEEQAGTMFKYMLILKKRAEIEQIDLGE